MKIERIILTKVSLPLAPMYVSSRGIKRTYGKTIIQVVTDVGLIGLGETDSSRPVAAWVPEIAARLIGADPLNRLPFRAPPAVSGAGGRRDVYESVALGGFEIAFWDLAGKFYGLPLACLLGGRRRCSIPMVCELSAAPFDPSIPDEGVAPFFECLANVDRVVESAIDQIKVGGYRILKLKTTGTNPAWDVRVMTALREAVGPSVELRYDCNGAYAPVQAAWICRQLDVLGLQWLEDPTTGLEGMRRLRNHVATRLATNMWVTQFRELAPAIRLGGIDVIGIDAFHWGGLANARDVADICATFDLGVFVHCFFDLGITTAANLHLASGLVDPGIGVDTCLYLQTDDVIRGAFRVKDGELPVPSTPGLGIELDEDALRRLCVEQSTIASF